METSFRGPQVCAIVGVTYRQLDYWARTDLVRPSITEARGSGTQRLYSFRDLVELKLAKRLLEAGVSLQAARRAVPFIRERPPRELRFAMLVLAGVDLALAYDADEVADLLGSSRCLSWVVSIEMIIDEIAEAVALQPAA